MTENNRHSILVEKLNKQSPSFDIESRELIRAPVIFHRGSICERLVRLGVNIWISRACRIFNNAIPGKAMLKYFTVQSSSVVSELLCFLTGYL